MMDGFTVCVLFYGDHLRLAMRCLASILKNTHPDYVRQLRVGLNEVSADVREYVLAELRNTHVPSLVYDPGKNVLKYPLMRRMFHDPDHPIETLFMQWFDDDSCLAPDTDLSWWRTVHTQMQDADMLGDLWTYPFHGNMQEGIKVQPWYRGVPWKRVKDRPVMLFATGGWWTIRTKLIQQWDYPWPALQHNGGDCTLGEMLRQQGLRLKKFKDGVWINADKDGNNSKAARRGTHTRYVWADYKPDMRLDAYEHHQFECRVFDPKSNASTTSSPLGPPPPILKLPGITS